MCHFTSANLDFVCVHQDDLEACTCAGPFLGWTVVLRKYILFAGREVRIEKNCARGLEYGPRPQAEGCAQDRGHSFSQYGPTKAGK